MSEKKKVPYAVKEKDKRDASKFACLFFDCVTAKTAFAYYYKSY